MSALIAQTKAEIAEEKKRLKAETQRRKPSKPAPQETKKYGTHGRCSFCPIDYKEKTK